MAIQTLPAFTVEFIWMAGEEARKPKEDWNSIQSIRGEARYRSIPKSKDRVFGINPQVPVTIDLWLVVLLDVSLDLF